MAELFKGYENDFSKYIASANKKVATLPASQQPDTLISEAKNDIQEAEHWLRQMENEIISLPPNVSSQYQPRLKRHQENLLNLKKSLNNEQARKNKVDLIGNAAGVDKRTGLISQNELLQETGETLERTYKVGIEAETTANNTMNVLKGQRIQLQGINDKVNDVGTNVNKANRVITSMDRRRKWMKLIMLVIIVLLMIAIAIALYIKVG